MFECYGKNREKKEKEKETHKLTILGKQNKRKQTNFHKERG